jgi:hypothetical protein
VNQPVFASAYGQSVVVHSTGCRLASIQFSAIARNGFAVGVLSSGVVQNGLEDFTAYYTLTTPTDLAWVTVTGASLLGINRCFVTVEQSTAYLPPPPPPPPTVNCFGLPESSCDYFQAEGYCRSNFQQEWVWNGVQYVLESVYASCSNPF